MASPRLSSVFVPLALIPLVLESHSGRSDEPAAGPPRIEIRDARISLADQRLLAGGQTGLIAEVGVREGDQVATGQVLATLDDRVPRANLAVVTKEADNDIDVRFARKAAEVAKTEYRQAVAANDLEPQTFSEIEVEKLKLEQERSLLQIEVAEHQQELNRLRRSEAESLVATHQIVAPLDGVVTRVFKRAGEAVQAGEPLLEIKRTDVVHVEADLPVEFLGVVQPGDTVIVRPQFVPRGRDRRPEPPRGTIFFVDVSADSVARTVRILVEVENREGALIAGLRADLTIELTSRTAAAPAK